MTREEIANMPASAKMNQLVWWQIFDMQPTPPNNDMALLPDFSGDMNCAWLVVKKFPEFYMEHTEESEFAMLADDFDTVAIEPTMPLAICKCALLATLDSKKASA